MSSNLAEIQIEISVMQAAIKDLKTSLALMNHQHQETLHSFKELVKQSAKATAALVVANQAEEYSAYAALAAITATKVAAEAATEAVKMANIAALIARK